MGRWPALAVALGSRQFRFSQMAVLSYNPVYSRSQSDPDLPGTIGIAGWRRKAKTAKVFAKGQSQTQRKGKTKSQNLDNDILGYNRNRILSTL